MPDMLSRNLILFDDKHRDQLLPLVFTRPVADIRIGIRTIREKWEAMLGVQSSTCTTAYLQTKYQELCTADNLVVNGCVIPDADVVAQVQSLKHGQSLWCKDLFVAGRSEKAPCHLVGDSGMDRSETRTDVLAIRKPWDIFLLNGVALEKDLQAMELTPTASVHPSNTVFGDQLYLAEDTSVRGAMINTETGPVYIGPGAVVMEGAMIRGPVAICDHAEVKMGAKIYGPTTVGPHSKVGGELNNVVFFGYSNKAHDGFLGNSVIGEWCNLGADTNCSNLKNNYGLIRAWSYADNGYTDTGLQFCGLIMGDHSKAGINTMFNTGTVVGVSANIYGGGFPAKYIPSFSWGGVEGIEKYAFDKAADVAQAVMERRKVTFTPADRNILRAVFDQS